VVSAISFSSRLRGGTKMPLLNENGKGLFFYVLLLLNYVYMFSGLVFAFWILNEHPFLAGLILVSAFAFFKGLIGLKNNLDFYERQKLLEQAEQSIDGLNVSDLNVLDVNNSIVEVDKNGVAKKSKNRTKN
jgi:hypothetical protein